MDKTLSVETLRHQAKMEKAGWIRAFNAALHASYSVTIRDTGLEAREVFATYGDQSPAEAASLYASKYGLISRAEIGLR